MTTRDRRIESHHTRWMIHRDMPEVLAIDGATPHPWDMEQYLCTLRQRNCIGMVSELGDETVTGMVVYELHKERLDVVRLAVGEQFRRRGVGTAIIRKLIGKLSSHRRNCITFDVRESAVELQLFLRAVGFRCERIKREHYHAGVNDDVTDFVFEDGYTFTYRFSAG